MTNTNQITKTFLKIKMLKNILDFRVVFRFKVIPLQSCVQLEMKQYIFSKEWNKTYVFLTRSLK